MRVDVDLIEMGLAELLMEQEDLVSRLEDGTGMRLASDAMGRGRSAGQSRVAVRGPKMSVDGAKAIVRAFESNTVKLYGFRRALAELPQEMRGGTALVLGRVEKAIREFESDRDRAAVVVKEYEVWLREKGKAFLRGVAKDVVASLLKSNPGWKVDFVDSGTVDEPTVKVTVRDTAGIVQFMLAVGQDARDPGVGTRVWWQEGGSGSWNEGSRVRTTDDTSAVVREVLQRGEAVAVRSWSPAGERAVSSGGEAAARALSQVGLKVDRPEVKSAPSALEQSSDVKVRGSAGEFLFLVRVWSTFRSGMSAGWSLSEDGSGKFEERVALPGGERDVPRVVSGFQKAFEALREVWFVETERDLVSAGRGLKRTLLNGHDLWVVEVGDPIRVLGASTVVRLPVVVQVRPAKGRHARPLWEGKLVRNLRAAQSWGWAQGPIDGQGNAVWSMDVTKAVAGLVAAVESKWGVERESVWASQAQEDLVFLKAVLDSGGDALFDAFAGVGDGWKVSSDVGLTWQYDDPKQPAASGNAGLTLRVLDESGKFLFLLTASRNRREPEGTTLVNWTDKDKTSGGNWSKGTTHVPAGNGSGVGPAMVAFAESFVEKRSGFSSEDASVGKAVREFLLEVARIGGSIRPQVKRTKSSTWELTDADAGQPYRYPMCTVTVHPKDASVEWSLSPVVQEVADFPLGLRWYQRYVEKSRVQNEKNRVEREQRDRDYSSPERKLKTEELRKQELERARLEQEAEQGALAVHPVIKREVKELVRLVPGATNYGLLQNVSAGVAAADVRLDKDTVATLKYDAGSGKYSVTGLGDPVEVSPGDLAATAARLYREMGGDKRGPLPEMADVVSRIEGLVSKVSAGVARHGQVATVRSMVGVDRKEWAVGKKGGFVAHVWVRGREVGGALFVKALGRMNPSVDYRGEADLFSNLLVDVEAGPTGPRLVSEHEKEKLEVSRSRDVGSPWRNVAAAVEAAARRLGWEGKLANPLPNLIRGEDFSDSERPAQGLLPAPAGVPVEAVLDSWLMMFPDGKEVVSAEGRSYEVKVSYGWVSNVAYEADGDIDHVSGHLPGLVKSLRALNPTRVWPERMTWRRVHVREVK